MSTLTLCVKRLDNNAKLPARAKASDSGFDLCSIEDKVIYPEETSAIRTGIAVQCSEPVSIEVWPRSGLSLKGWLVHRSLIAFDPGAGLIDPGYTGEIRVVIHNVGVDPIHVQAGMRIAQLKFSPLLIPIVEEVDRLGETDRGADGFGSTGHSTVEDARPVNSQPYFTIDHEYGWKG